MQVLLSQELLAAAAQLLSVSQHTNSRNHYNVQ